MVKGIIQAHDSTSASSPSSSTTMQLTPLSIDSGSKHDSESNRLPDWYLNCSGEKPTNSTSSGASAGMSNKNNNNRARAVTLTKKESRHTHNFRGKDYSMNHLIPLKTRLMPILPALVIVPLLSIFVAVLCYMVHLYGSLYGTCTGENGNVIDTGIKNIPPSVQLSSPKSQ